MFSLALNNFIEKGKSLDGEGEVVVTIYFIIIITFTSLFLAISLYNGNKNGQTMK